MDYLTNHYKNLCEQLQEKINFLSKLLNEESNEQWSPQKQQEWINSIHEMPLDEAESHGQLDLVAGNPIFVDNGLMQINDNHAFTKFLTHPDHSNESVREHINFLLKVAHRDDHAGGDEKIRHYGNENQSAVFQFARQHYPTLAYAMADFAMKKNNRRPGSYGAGSGSIPSKEPIQITPEHLDQINREHGAIKLSFSLLGPSPSPRNFINSRKDPIVSAAMAEWHINNF